MTINTINSINIHLLVAALCLLCFSSRALFFLTAGMLLRSSIKLWFCQAEMDPNTGIYFIRMPANMVKQHCFNKFVSYWFIVLIWHSQHENKLFFHIVVNRCFRIFRHSLTFWESRNPKCIYFKYNENVGKNCTSIRLVCEAKALSN